MAACRRCGKILTSAFNVGSLLEQKNRYCFLFGNRTVVQSVHDTSEYDYFGFERYKHGFLNDLCPKWENVIHFNYNEPKNKVRAMICVVNSMTMTTTRITWNRYLIKVKRIRFKFHSDHTKS